MQTCCTKHPYEHVRAACRRCGEPWCADCLVYVFGPDKPPLCIECAMLVGGVRSTGRPRLSRKELRARKREEKRAARAARNTEPAEQSPPPVHEPSLPPLPARRATDWATPWWDADPAANPAPVD